MVPDYKLLFEVGFNNPHYPQKNMVLVQFTKEECDWWLSKEWGKVTPAGWGYQPYIDTVTWWRDASPEEKERIKLLALVGRKKDDTKF